jgi:uncharacterized protein YheU (UPF0270 family)
MARITEVPSGRLDPDVLRLLLEDYASRDGTDYGEVEQTLDQKVESLRRQLNSGELSILFDTDCELWDLVPRDTALRLLEAC